MSGGGGGGAEAPGGAPGNDLAAAVERAAAALRRGGIVLMPTDTVYGLAALPSCPEAVERLYALKAREARKPIALLAASLKDVTAAGAVLGREESALAGWFWPGPLTLVLRVKQGGTEGFRVPDCAAAAAVLAAAGGVLRVTSANLSGEPPARCAGEALAQLGEGGVDAVVDAGPARGGTASSVVRVTGGRVEILREGALGAAQLRAAARRARDG